MKRTISWIEVLFTILYIILYTGGPFYLILSNGYSEGDTAILEAPIPVFDFSLVKNLFLLNYVLTAALLALRWKQVLSVVRRSPTLLLFVAFAACSTLWSVEASITFNRSIALIGTTLFGLYLASRYTLRQQCYIIATSYGLIMLASIAFVVLLPHYGISGGAHTGAWRGIYQHKNNLGNLMAVATLLFLLLIQDARTWFSKLLFVGCGLCSMSLLLLSQSKTGLVTAIAISISLPFWNILKLRLRVFVPTLLLSLCITLFGLLLLFSNVETLVLWLGKDLTLTGRTDIWAITWELITRHPWLGYGFSSFWESGWGYPVEEIWRTVDWQTVSAHNAWLDVWIQLGFIGLLLYVVNTTSVVWQTLKSARKTPSATQFWPLALLSYLLITSLVESPIPVENDIFWVFYASIAFTVAAQSRRYSGLTPISPTESSTRAYALNPFANPLAKPPNDARLQEDDRGSGAVHQDYPRQQNSPRSEVAAQLLQQYRATLHLCSPALPHVDAPVQTSQARALQPFEAPADENSHSRRDQAQLQTAPQPISPSSALPNVSHPRRNTPDINQGSKVWRVIGHWFRPLLAKTIPPFLKNRLSNLNFAGRAIIELTARLLRVAVQASYFIILTRTLSVQEYGIFTSIVATVGLVAPFSSLGAEHLIVRNLSRDRQRLSQFFGHALSISFIFSVMLTLAVTVISYIFFSDKVSLLFTLLVAIADLFFFKIIEICQNIFLTLERAFEAAVINILMSLKNLGAILFFVLFINEKTLSNWSICYCVGTAVAAILSFYICSYKLQAPLFSSKGLLDDWKEGFYFSIGQSAHFVNSNVDKTMLLRWGTSAEAGIYGAAYRIITIAFTPMMSLMAISYAKFFSSGSQGLKGTLGFATKILPFAAGYGVLSSIFLALCAPLIIWLFGSDYADCIVAVRWLSPLLLIHSVKFLLEDSLAGAGLQRPRSILQIAAASLNIFLNLLLLPSFSWRGAAWSSLASELFLIIGLIYCVHRYYRQEKTAELSI